MLAQYYLQADMLLWHTFGYFHILAMLNCLCSLWFINCTAKGRVASWLANDLHQALESPDRANKLAEYRHLWVDLSHMMQQLGKRCNLLIFKNAHIKIIKIEIMVFMLFILLILFF